MTLLMDIGSVFVLGVLTPLTAVCVLPLYPGFLTFLTNQLDEDAARTTYALLGGVVAAGVILFMLLVGILFTTVLQVSLTRVVETVSPIAFGILAGIGLLLLLDMDVARFFPQKQVPRTGRPLVDAFGFGFFFGAIVIPCNPAFIAAFFARSLLMQSPATNLLAFTAFGLGIGAPLFMFSLVSAQWSRQVIQTLIAYKTWINRGSGTVLLGISLYYLFFVFQVVPFIG